MFCGEMKKKMSNSFCFVVVIVLVEKIDKSESYGYEKYISALGNWYKINIKFFTSKRKTDKYK